MGWGDYTLLMKYFFPELTKKNSFLKGLPEADRVSPHVDQPLRQACQPGALLPACLGPHSPRGAPALRPGHQGPSSTVKSASFHFMWSNFEFLDAGFARQNLATLCPDLILPTLVERLGSSLEVVTEPHKLTASLHSMIGVARSLVTYSRGLSSASRTTACTAAALRYTAR